MAATNRRAVAWAVTDPKGEEDEIGRWKRSLRPAGLGGSWDRTKKWREKLQSVLLKGLAGCPPGTMEWVVESWNLTFSSAVRVNR